MVAQDNFIVVAEVREDRVEALRALLATMTLPGFPGVADPANALVPFGAFNTIHFARLVVLEDNTLGDRAPYPRLPRTEPTYLCLMVDCDGDAATLLARMARHCPGLQQIFSFCADFDPAAELERWMTEHRVPASASYVNWLGRTVVQAREEARLREFLRETLPRISAREPQLDARRTAQRGPPESAADPDPADAARMAHSQSRASARRRSSSRPFA